MIAVVQRVYEASVKVDGEIIGSIGNGLLVFLCVENRDTDDKVTYMSEKILNLRIFEDNNGKMSKSLQDINGDMLIISQFTLAGDCSKGRRPDFTEAAKPDAAKETYNKFIEDVSGRTDFPSGSQVELEKSIMNKLYILPDDTMVLPGHGFHTTIKHEKEYNPFIHV